MLSNRIWKLQLLIYISTFIPFLAQGQSDNILGYINTYQKYVSGIRGGSCPMFPSCSVYGYQAFKSYGFVKAFMATSDRLLRCGHERNQYSLTYQNNKFYLLDPVNYNDIKNLQVISYSRIFPIRDTLEVANEHKTLVRNLMIDKMYSEAIIEIRRQFIRGGGNDLELMTNYLRCLIALDMLELAVSFFEENQDILVHSGNALFTMAQVWNYLGDWENEEKFLKKTKEVISDEDIVLMKIKLHLASSYSNQNKLNLVRQELSDIPSSSLNFSQASYKLKSLDEIENMKFKKPFIAGAMSIFPGMGYVYSNRVQTALSAFVINGLFMFATYTSFKNDNIGAGSLFGLFGVTFYASGIIGSIKSTKRHNQNKYNNKIKKIQTYY